MSPLYVHITLATDGVPDRLTLCGKSVPKITDKTPVFVCGRCVIASIARGERNIDELDRLAVENFDLHERLNEITTALGRPGAARGGAR